MHSSVLGRSRQVRHLCDACKQHQRSVSTASRATPVLRRRTARPAAILATPSVSPSQIQTKHLASSPSSQHPMRAMSASARFGRPASSGSATATTHTSTTTTRTTEAHDDGDGGRGAKPADASHVTPQVPQTHYEFFPQTLAQGPPPSGSFDIDLRALRREFLQLQAKAHPDLHPAHLKPRAEATSARINEAYRTLSSPLLRAQYLLSLPASEGGRGHDPAADEAGKVEDPELLMEVLEAREAIEEAVDEADLEPLRARNDEREGESIEALARCFREGDLDAAAEECVRLRYWVNIRESIHNWEKGKPVVLEH
ncbi:HSCB C-terminal oligomerization domain-containing protein [Xylariales sp. PMI_506]|nr:HSCB C-terminal oligomerization domain-containing protein [Xylariales sp. PMI_506]